MYVDQTGALDPFLGDSERLIPQEHLQKVCNIGTEHKACRYAGITLQGWVCAKHTPLKVQLDRRVEVGISKRNLGDNCDGFGSPK